MLVPFHVHSKSFFTSIAWLYSFFTLNLVANQVMLSLSLSQKGSGRQNRVKTRGSGQIVDHNPNEDMLFSGWYPNE